MPHVRVRVYTGYPGIMFNQSHRAGAYGFQDNVNVWYHLFLDSQRTAVEAELGGVPYRIYPTTLSEYSEDVYIVLSWDPLLDDILNAVNITMPWVIIQYGLGEVLSSTDHEKADSFLLFDP